MSAEEDPPKLQVSAAEFVLEGLHAHKRIGRNEERVFSAGEKQPKRDQPEGQRDPANVRDEERPDSRHSRQASCN